MLKFLTQVAVSQAVTSIALLSSHELHNSDFPFPTTHRITLEFCAEAAGVRSSNAVPVMTSEIVVTKVVIVVLIKASILRIWDDRSAQGGFLNMISAACRGYFHLNICCNS
jgi:hypothetical protein